MDSLVVQLVKNPPAVRETLVWFLGEGTGYPLLVFLGFPHGSDGKESAYNAGDLGLIPGLGRSLEEGMDSEPRPKAGKEGNPWKSQKALLCFTDKSITVTSHYVNSCHWSWWNSNLRRWPPEFWFQTRSYELVFCHIWVWGITRGIRLWVNNLH